MSQQNLTGLCNYRFSQTLQDLSVSLNDANIMTLVQQVAESVDTLKTPAEQFAAERVLAFYLQPEASPDDRLQQTIFTAWQSLIRTLDKTDYARSLPLISAMSAKFEYTPLDAPFAKTFRQFRRDIAEPHHKARERNLQAYD